MATTQFIIQTPAGYVYRFDTFHQLVTLTDSPSQAKVFSERLAHAFIKTYGDIGYGLQSATARVIARHTV